ncbi:MAG: spermidine/putrescine ABC transporter ATP-binding protein PotA [Deltaproteobacteria bacterium]|nr:MAG: spermidine/putrescine ABC transporter ATP-binding protein PotA [Deltaproteobacteria bacterium]
MQDVPVIELREVCKYFGSDLVLKNFSLQVTDGEFLTLLGASGCGKTTVLRLIGGFETCDSGAIFLDGRPVAGIPPEARAVNTVFQNYALFPHLDVFENIAFGLRMGGKKTDELTDAVKEAMALVQLEGMGRRKPAELSGGQQQRVAIARALVNKPRILLLDEPLSALDYRLRKEMQKELQLLQKTLGITFILVTHDQEEAFAMSDRVVVMRAGAIEQIGSPREIYEEPVNLHVARFVGEINVLDGRILNRMEDGTCEALVQGTRVKVKAPPSFGPGDLIHVLLRPEDFRLELYRDLATDETITHIFEKALLKGSVERTCYRGATYDVEVRLDHGKTILVSEFFDEDAETLYFNPGDEVAVSWFAGWEVILPYVS